MAAALLSQALAPVVQALRARGQNSTGIFSSDAPALGCEAVGKSSRGLPEMDYPVPVVVKNTFINADISRPLSIEGFYLEREARSTPVSMIESAPGLREVPFEPALSAKHSEGPSVGPASSSSGRSTSVGSSSARSGLDESPGGQPEASPQDAAESCSLADKASVAGESSTRSSAGLPDLEYPAPLFVKNTFLDTDIGRPFSIDGLLEERQLRSCPGSALCPPPDDCQELEGSGWSFFGSTPECTPLLPHCRPMSLPFSIPFPPVEPFLSVPAPVVEAPRGIPPPVVEAPRGIPLPPAQPPVLPAELTFQAPTPPVPAMPAPASAPAAPLLLLSNALQAGVGGAPALPSVGSNDHHLGTCKPCAHAFSAKGCRNGAQCAFCHLCPPGELKRQQKVKRLAHRSAAAV